MTSQDVAHFKISDQYSSEKSGLTNIYLQQTHQGIGVHNGIFNIHIDAEGLVKHYGNRFVPNLQNKVNPSAPKLTAIEAVEKSAEHLGYSITRPIHILKISKEAHQPNLLSKSNISQKDIPAHLVWYRMVDKKLRLAWEISILEVSGHNWWNVFIDAQNGEMIGKNNWTLSCDWEHEGKEMKALGTLSPLSPDIPEATLPDFLAGTYRVYPIGIESPNHGSLEDVSAANDLTASPFGWHDTDGNVGAEHTITRGNNVYSQEDRNADNIFGTAPDGGPTLTFLDTPDFNENPTNTTNQNAAITNLFYWNNILHDVLYHFGFDEAAGNFQENNYGNGGIGNDFVVADAQDGAGVNNANFATPPDGESPRMQMFLWSRPSFVVNSPGGITGAYSTAAASFGPSNFNISGNLVLVDDGTAPITDACQDLTENLTGSIALIDRGICHFSCKVERAQSQGAIAAIVCNNVEGNPFNMGYGDCGDNVSIPSMMISQSDCDIIKANLPNVNVTLDLETIDGDFDNGIIAHEYGHGISNRLTGGPSAAGCLFNAEQMGEGWSDFIGLYLTTDASHTATEARGIGTFALGQPTTGIGIRLFPYSTDMGVNPYTYSNISSVAIPHGVGTVWCTMLWELYWALVEEYGFDEDYYFGTGGNNIAFQLVIEAMKIQPCIPGFVDGRDAILAADRVLYGGANQCLIWEAFAKRGLGYSANQGSTADVTDGTEAFDMPPSCLIALTTSVNLSTAIPNTELEYNISVQNITENPISDIAISSEIVALTSYVAGSASNGGSLNSNIVEFPTFSLASDEIQMRTFRVLIDENPSSDSHRLEDDVENGNDKWTTTATNPAIGNWIISNTNPHSGNNSWFAPDVDSPNAQYLQIAVEEQLTSNSFLSFWHSFDTEATWDGGTVEISLDNGDTWTDLGPLFTKNGYNSTINENPGQPAFSGNSGGYIESVIDLGAYADEFAFIRFNMYCDYAAGGEGWYIDDISLLFKQPSIPHEANLSFAALSSSAILENPTTLTGVLPLELKDFSGQALEKSNLLEWQTLLEHDMSHFILDRSKNGKNDWELIARVETKEKQEQLHHYQVYDGQPLPLAFYRLRMVENSGKELLSGLVLIERKDDDWKDFKLYPNPAKDEVFLEFLAFRSNTAEVFIQNMLGQEQHSSAIQVQRGFNKIRLDVKGWNSGVYWLNLRQGKEKLWTGKIIIN